MDTQDIVVMIFGVKLVISQIKMKISCP